MIIGGGTPQRSTGGGGFSRSNNKSSSRGAFGYGTTASNTPKPNIKKSVQYEYGISFYEDPPEGEINLEQAEDIVQERIKILSTISSLEAPKNNPKDYFDKIKSELAKIPAPYNEHNKVWPLQSIGSSKGNPNIQEARRRDHVSHYLCRLYFCRTADLRKWFVDQECELMRMRLFDVCTKHEGAKIEEILDYNGFECESALDWTPEEFQFKYRKTDLENGKKQFYKFPFEETIHLMARRRVVIKNGYSYVDSSELASILQTKYRHYLNKSLIDLFLILSDLGEEQRLLPRIGAVHERVKKDLATARLADSLAAGKASNKISREQIPALAQLHFPPCMKHLHREITDKSHLKHFGRLHYGLFLKAIGLPIEEALLFFRDHFTKSGNPTGMTPEAFQKHYAYNIRHTYGLEGARKDLSAYSCQKIQSQGPGPGECHGCPFKHMDPPNLTKLLSLDGIPADATSEILTMSSENNPSGACLKYFASTRGFLPRDGTIYHPNQFFIASKRGPPPLPATTTQPNGEGVNLVENDTLADSNANDINDTSTPTSQEVNSTPTATAGESGDIKNGDNDGPVSESAKCNGVENDQNTAVEGSGDNNGKDFSPMDSESGGGGDEATAEKVQAEQEARVGVSEEAKGESGENSCKMDVDMEPVTGGDQSPLAPPPPTQ